MAHPNNAAFISGDGLVSFDEYGRKLDGLGNVVAEDYQSLRGANAQPNQAYWQRKFEEEMRALQPPAPPPQAQGMTPGLAVGGVGVGAGEMGSGGAGAAPGQSNSTAGRWQPPPSGLGMPGGQGAPPRYDPLASAVPGSQRTFDPPPQNRPMPPAMGAPLPPAPRGGAMGGQGGQGGLNGQGALPSPYAPGAGEMGMPQVGQMGDNRRPGLMHVGGPAPAMPTRDQRPQPMPQPMMAPPPPMGTPMAPRMGTPTPQPMGTPMPPARAPTWTPYQPYGVNAPLPGLSREDEESINRAVPGSQRTFENYMPGLGLPMPDNQRFDPPPQNRPMPQVGQMGDNRRPGLMHVGGPAPAMPTRDQRPQPMPQPMGTPMPPARAPTWTPYQPYGVNAPLPGLSREDEESINRAVLWR